MWIIQIKGWGKLSEERMWGEDSLTVFEAVLTWLLKNLHSFAYDVK